MCALRPVGNWKFFSGLKLVLDYKSRMVIYNSFVKSNFNYNPIVWMFSNNGSLEKKMENIQNRALRFVLNDF